MLDVCILVDIIAYNNNTVQQH